MRLRALVVIVVAAVALGGCGFGPTARASWPKQPQSVGNERFIESVAPHAQAAMRKDGVPASVSIAQSILESGWGRSGLSVWGGAYFGIKCSRTPSPLQAGCVNLSSMEYYDPESPKAEVSAFRTYDSPANSFADHGHFLRHNSRYAPAFDTSDATEFINQVAAAGYATDPEYADTVISIIKKFDLTRFDKAQGTLPSADVDGPIGLKWKLLGGPKSVLGPVIGGETEGPAHSTLVVFTNGIMVWTAEAGAHPITGPVWHFYRSHPADRKKLGMVTADEHTADGAKVQEFANGRIAVRGGKATAEYR